MAVNLKIVSQVVTSGTPGPAGKSAYQIAVDNGFEGTESEWLKELHPFKGWFDSVSELEEEHSAPSVGEYAYVKGAASSDPVKIYECSTEGSWSDSGRTVDTSTVQTFRSGESVNDVDITDDSSDIEENSDKIPTAGAVADALDNAEFSTGEKVKNVGIDDEPTAGSENLVKSGGVYNELALGAVYDVSAKNPTAGPNNDGKWESLTALLSDANLNTLIPTSVRKGGMSIKFVHSSDNNYVQYSFLLSGTFTDAQFTNVDNWQGVEDVSAYGSKNLVESNGIFNETHTGKVVNINATDTDTILRNKVINSNPTIGQTLVPADQSGNLLYVHVIPANSVVSVTMTSGGTYYFVITDMNDIVLEKVKNFSGTKVFKHYTSQVKLYLESAHYVSSNYTIYTPVTTSIEQNKNDIIQEANRAQQAESGLGQDITTLSNATTTEFNKVKSALVGTKSFNFINSKENIKSVPYPVINGAMYDYTTTPTYKYGNTSYKCYPLIPVSKTAKYYYTGAIRQTASSGVLYYDKDFQRIGRQFAGTGSSVTYTDEELTVPANAAYIAISFQDANITGDFSLKVLDYTERYDERFYTEKLFAKEYTDVDLGTLNDKVCLDYNGTTVIRSAGGSSNMIQIDKTKNYILQTYVDAYGVGVQFFGDSAGTEYKGFQISSSSGATKTEILHIPSDANYMRVGTRGSTSYLKLKTFTNVESAPLSKLNDYILKQQGSENADKYLIVGADGNVTLGEGSGGGGESNPDAVVLHKTKKLYLGSNLLNNPTVSVGTGWSGDFTNGYTHSSGNTDPIIIQQATTSGKSYLVECTLSVAAEGSILLSIGNSPLVDVYNGSTTVKYGFKADGGYLKITPDSSYTGSVSNIMLKEVVSEASAVETLTISIGNVENGTMDDNITGFWNTAIGYINTLQRNQNGSRNIAIGYSALASLKSGTRNLGIGTFAGVQLVEGDCNIGIGADSLYFLKKGRDNIGIGKAAIGNMIYGELYHNISIGEKSMGGYTATAQRNIAIGYLACFYSGEDNIGIGYQANYWTRGKRNIAIGTMATYTKWLTGDNNVAIGYHASCGTQGESAANPNTVSNAIAIGANATATKSNQTVIGNSSTTETKVYGDLIVRGTDSVLRKVVFNNDNTVSWETIS